MRPLLPACARVQAAMLLTSQVVASTSEQQTSHVALSPQEVGAKGVNFSLVFGGEVRLRYERYENAQWGLGAQDQDGYGLLRAMFHADFQRREWRSFVELKSGLIAGRTGGPRATDEDRLDVHQAFWERAWKPGEKAKALLRVGRQELTFGSSRLVSVRESPNVRLAFDGIRWSLRKPDYDVDLFAAHPVETNPRALDDGTDRRRALWGLYSVFRPERTPQLTLDIYYIGAQRDGAVFAKGVANEERHSWGARISGKRGGWDFNTEGVLQAGRFGSRSIWAWTVASDTGFSWTKNALRPRVGLKADVSSGDTSAEDGALGTFNALYPKGSYFGEISLLGPANLLDVQPSVEVQLNRNLSATAVWGFYWRHETSDGVYGSSLSLLQKPKPGLSARDLGHSPSLLLRWNVKPKLTLTATGAFFKAGRFLREARAAQDVTYLSIWVTQYF